MDGYSKINYAELTPASKEKRLLLWKDITVINELGVGAFGKVSKAKWCNEVIVIKTVIRHDTDTLDNEISILEEIRHPNIVLYLIVHY